jgi:hypothetical protein
MHRTHILHAAGIQTTLQQRGRNLTGEELRRLHRVLGESAICKYRLQPNSSQSLLVLAFRVTILTQNTAAETTTGPADLDLSQQDVTGSQDDNVLPILH